MSASRYVVREADVPGFVPENHDGTLNKRLVSRDNVGAERMEVVLGIVDNTHVGGGSRPHLHADMEQANYFLSGRARVEVGDETHEVGPGDTCFFPAGVPHAVTRIGVEPLKVLVIYSAPLASS